MEFLSKMKSPFVYERRLKKLLFVFAFADVTAAASASLFRAADADCILFANVTVFIEAAVANVTVDFLVKMIVHIIPPAVAVISR